MPSPAMLFLFHLPAKHCCSYTEIGLLGQDPCPVDMMETVDSLRLLKVEEVARLVKLSRGSVYAAMQRGELGYVRLGGSRRIPAAEVEAWINRGFNRPR